MTILEPEDLERKILSVGKPVLGADIRILGEDDREVAPGETGEIVGRGRLVMAGYHAQDAGEPRGDLDRRGRRAVAAHRRSWPARCRGLSLHRRSQEGHDPLGRPEHLSGRYRERHARAPGGRRGGGDRHRRASAGARRRWPWWLLHAGCAAGRRRARLEWTNARVGKQQRISGWCGARVCRETPTARYSSANFGENTPQRPPARKDCAMNAATPAITSTTAPMACVCTAASTPRSDPAACRCCACRG